MLSKTQLKYIQSLGHKKGRDESNEFIVEGPKIISEVLTAPNIIVKHIYAVKEWIDANRNAISRHTITEISTEELQKVSQLTTPNQVIAIVQKTEWKEDPGNKLFLLLDGIQDPGNLGTIIRTADWFGIKKIICSTDCADVYNPKVIQSTMGSFVRVRVEYSDLLSFLDANEGLKTYAAVLDGQPVEQLHKISEGMIIIGNESKGINSEILAKADFRITVAGKGNAESLNASVATGIILSYLC